jgi:hypothetical protein
VSSYEHGHELSAENLLTRRENVRISVGFVLCGVKSECNVGAVV